jgi:hypothetical protein
MRPLSAIGRLRDGQSARPPDGRRPGCPRGNGRPANAFAKLKAILRKAAARTIPSLWNAIRDALPQFTPEECANFFTAAGYEPE